MRAGGTNEGPRLERRVVYSLQAAMPLVVLGLSTSIIADRRRRNIADLGSANVETCALAWRRRK
jgi:hypothetical protein